MKTEETNTNENKTCYIVYRIKEIKKPVAETINGIPVITDYKITYDIENIFDSRYPLELCEKFGFDINHFNDYILKDTNDWNSSHSRYSNMFIIKDTD